MCLYQILTLDLPVHRVHKTIIPFSFCYGTCTTRFDPIRIQWVYVNDLHELNILLFVAVDGSTCDDGDGLDDPLNNPKGIVVAVE
jgi:hypothetical protein